MAAFGLTLFASGFLQAFPSAMLPEVAERLGVGIGELNWLDGAQFTVAAGSVPILARLGDRYGHRAVLTGAVALATAAALVMPWLTDFAAFLCAWALQGTYPAWLPLMVVLIWGDSADAALEAGRASGALVAALEAGVLLGLVGGGALVRDLPVSGALLVPAVVLLAALAALVLQGRVLAASSPSRRAVPLDLRGWALLALTLGLFNAGLGTVRSGDPRMGVLLLLVGIAFGVVLFVAGASTERPLIDPRLIKRRSLWPLCLAAITFGVSFLGAQTATAAYIRLAPGDGAGLGLTPFLASMVLVSYALGLVAGGLLYRLVAPALPARTVLCVALAVVAAGYLLLIPFHGSLPVVVVVLLVQGLSSGAVMAATPVAAAVGASIDRVAEAGGLVVSLRVGGGAAAACVFGIFMANGPQAGAFFAVWLVCAGSALLGAVCAWFLPARATGSGPVGIRHIAVPASTASPDPDGRAT